MGHAAVAKAPGKLGKYLNKGIRAVTVLKWIQKSSSTTRCAALFNELCQISRKHKIGNDRYDQKANKHQASLYKVRHADSHKSAHKGVTENHSCADCQCHMIVDSEYCGKKLSSCCQCRCRIYQEKDYDHNG